MFNIKFDQTTSAISNEQTPFGHLTIGGMLKQLQLQFVYLVQTTAVEKLTEFFCVCFGHSHVSWLQADQVL